jgi:hypothetical protein
MASNTESIYDFGFAPKRNVATYGKTARRRTPASRPATLRHAESAPAVTTSSRRSESASPEPPRPAPRRLMSLKPRQQGTRANGTENRKAPAQEAQSQPTHDPYDFDCQPEEPVRPKKRRFARANSEKEKKAPVFYSTSDSSPTADQSPEVPSDEDAPKPIVAATARPKTQRATPERDITMKDAAPPSMPFSAKTTRRLKNLKVSSKPLKLEKKEIPIRLSGPPPSKPATEPPSRPLNAPTKD